MNSTLEADECRASTNRGSPLPAEAVGLEFTVHSCIVLGVLFLNVVVLPAFSWSIVTTVWVGSTIELAKIASIPTRSLDGILESVATLGFGILAAVPALAFGLYRGWITTRTKLAEDALAPNSRYKRVQTQRLATPLLALVDQLWADLPTTSGTTPTTVWFSNLGVVARALSSHEGPCIAVSVGLWERIVRGDPLARVVLLHEMAHLSFRDLRTIALFEGISEMSRTVLTILFYTVGATILWLGLSEITQGVIVGRPGTIVLGRLVGLVLIGSITGILAPMLLLLVRRYLGFLISLLELRADVVAAMWAGGLSRFAFTFAQDTSIHQSSVVELTRSLFSTELTHLPESERLDLLRHPARLMTPKLRYFAMSLIYPAVLPLTGFIGYILGGVFALISVIVVVAAVNITCALMLTLYVRLEAQIPLQRVLILSAALVAFMATPQIRLDAVNYFIVTSIASFTFEGSVGAADASMRQVWLDLQTTALDIGGQLESVVNRGWIIGSWIVTVAALSTIGAVGSRLAVLRGNQRVIFYILVACITMAAICVDGYNEWRGVDLFKIPATLWLDVTNAFPFLRLALAPICVACTFLITFLCERFVGWRHLWQSPTSKPAP